MRNFFRELKNCEDAVLSENAIFINLAGENAPYQESTKKMLCEVISIVSSGRFFRINSPSYFIVTINEQIRKLHKVVRMRKTYLPKSKEFVLDTRTKCLDFCAYYEFAHL